MFLLLVCETSDIVNKCIFGCASGRHVPRWVDVLLPKELPARLRRTIDICAMDEVREQFRRGVPGLDPEGGSRLAELHVGFQS